MQGDLKQADRPARSGKLLQVLVSGASGFLGSALLGTLARSPKYEAIGLYRTRPAIGHEPRNHAVIVGDLAHHGDWSALPRFAHALIHTAARVHRLAETAADPLAEYRRINVEGTLNLARQAAAAGLRRFVFISTIKVNGERTAPGQTFSADDAPGPSDPYGVSKWEAEQGLREIAARTGMEVVIIRPPLVYGPGVKGNFRTMLRWLSRGIPLPLGALHNRRSFVNLDNLIDLTVTCIEHPAAANQIFLASDDEDMSTPELLHRMGAALGRPARLISIPTPWLKAGAAALGKGDAVARLCDSLCVDVVKTRRMLDWNPATSVDRGLKKTAESFLLETRT